MVKIMKNDWQENLIFPRQTQAQYSNSASNIYFRHVSYGQEYASCSQVLTSVIFESLKRLSQTLAHSKRAR